MFRASLGDYYDSHKWTAHGLLTGLLSGSVLVAAWAAFEQSITVICKYSQKKEAIPLALDDLREKDLCQRLQQYLRVLTRQEFYLPHSLSEIQTLRNLFAHHNGSIEHLSVQKRNLIEAMIRSNTGVSVYDKHQIVLSQEYLRNNVQKIDECLTAILKFVEARYPYVEHSKV